METIGQGSQPQRLSEKRWPNPASHSTRKPGRAWSRILGETSARCACIPAEKRVSRPAPWMPWPTRLVIRLSLRMGSTPHPRARAANCWPTNWPIPSSKLILSSGSLTSLEIGATDSAQELEASRLASAAGKIYTPLSSLRLQRQPAQQTLRDRICYLHGAGLPNRQPGDCDTREPENCPTYELWLNTFQRLQHFTSTDTSPDVALTFGHTVLGQQATRQVDLPAGTQAPAARRPVPPDRQQTGDRFIDHPTDEWVRTCLPPNLRATAYELPSDCADIALILRHVWLAAHHRTERHRIPRPGHPALVWVLGDRAGRARQHEIRNYIVNEVYSGNIGQIVSPYLGANGQPLKTFADLENRLHPGDLLVWAHHEHLPQKANRTGGHTMTIVRIQRSGGHITRIEVLQGNQPIGPQEAGEINTWLQAHGEPTATEKSLRNAPGRRIEYQSLSGASLQDHPFPPPSIANVHSRPDVWTWADLKTTLVAAGPPASVARPATHNIGGVRVPRISDWFSALDRASRETLQPTLEAALLELRGKIDGGQTGLDHDAILLGRHAGDRLWNLARSQANSARGDRLAEESHFRPLMQMQAMIQALENPSGPHVARGFSSDAAPHQAEVARVFALLLDTFIQSGRGISSIDFNRRQPRHTTPFHVLVTGFDPFASGGSVPAGTVNPSGAAALALDHTSLREGRIFISVEGIVLPVDFEAFRRGMVENAVRPLVQSRSADAILTVSLDARIAPNQPVRLERYVVGVHSDRRGEAVPAAPGGGSGAAIIEAQAPTGGQAGQAGSPLEQIAQDTGQPAHGRTPGVPTPDIGTDITFQFGDASTADRALHALGQPTQGRAAVEISDPAAIQQILHTMRRQTNGAFITFQAGGDTFRTRIVSGPGGNFLSNEVSYRVLRLLAEEHRSDLPSFHVHVPRVLPGQNDVIPPKSGTAAGRRARRSAIATAVATRDRIIVTLRRLIRAVARRTVAQRGTGGSTHP